MKLTAEQIEGAKALHASGWRYARISEQYGVDNKTIRRALDPEYQARRCQQVRDARKLRETGVRNPRAGRENATSMSLKADWAARLAEIPADTRSLTARLCGDPLPGRDALSRTSRANGAET